MNFEQASEIIAEVDARELSERAARLVELDELLGNEDFVFSGQAAQWLFADVKATWLYGYFSGTVVSAYSFCLQQLAGLVRTLSDDPDLPDMVESVEDLAEICEGRGMIDVALRAKLVALQDSAAIYLSAELHEYQSSLERRLGEAEEFTEEHSLLMDARTALQCSASLLQQQ